MRRGNLGQDRSRSRSPDYGETRPDIFVYTIFTWRWSLTIGSTTTIASIDLVLLLTSSLSVTWGPLDAKLPLSLTTSIVGGGIWR